MAADIARVTYDPTRQYRAVISQQGRVTLEADNNEAAILEMEALRLETIDIVGPCGTPDDGYKVNAGPKGITIGPGILYLGGWRLELDKEIHLAKQPDRLNTPASAFLDTANFREGNFVVSLLVTEQSVCAIEDRALREVALGGPDSAARSRLMQRFLLEQTKGKDCAAGADTILGLLKEDGVTVDLASLQLMSTARLQAGFVPGPASTDPCIPKAAGGYLGADNQMVRVTVTEYSAASETGRLLWGWNNASLLYRATIGADGVTVTLTDVPVDQEHAPQQKQMVEILRSEINLGDGNFIAHGQGEVRRVAQAYSFDTQQLVLQNAVTAEYLNATEPLFVRLWQDDVAFEAGKATPLDHVSGITVAITMDALPTHIAARPFWHFAVRPGMPQNIYPQRYSDGPQPPDGPRQWITDLAVVQFSGEQWTLLANCRIPFLPLTKLGDCGCCSLVLDPSKDWLPTLNQAIASEAITALNICFMPGTFNVSNKIAITRKTVRMTGAGAGTQILGKGLEAVLEFDQCPDVGLSDLFVSADTAGYSTSSGTRNLQGAVTFRSCNEINVERVLLICASADLRSASCLAIYNPPPQRDAPPQKYNARILNSRFEVGHFQVGILVVNADRAQIEGNLVVNPLKPRDITIANLGTHQAVAYRLRKQVVQDMILYDTAPPTNRKARARLRKRQAKAKAGSETMAAKQSAADSAKTQPATTEATAVMEPKINLGLIGRAHIKASYGTFRLQFLSSEKLTNAWTDALRASGLNQSSTMGAIHKTVRNISRAVVLKPDSVSTGFRNWLSALLPQLYSTSSQGIVVGGNAANDVRILHNTVVGTAQGIHVGLSNIKEFGKGSPHLLARRVQIRGNTVSVRVTAEVTGDRHGIYLGCVTSGVISDNHLELTRDPSTTGAGQSVDSIKVAGSFGPLLLIERNYMLGFTDGIYTDPDATSLPPNFLWKVADNVSDTANLITNSMFIVRDNVPP